MKNLYFILFFFIGLLQINAEGISENNTSLQSEDYAKMIVALFLNILLFIFIFKKRKKQ